MEAPGGDLGVQAQPDEAKQFLYQWLAKQKATPNYNVRPAGTKQRQRFLCELAVEGYPYRGAGNSTSKKDAQTNAAKDFIQYLIRTGKIDLAELPQSVLAFKPAVPEYQIPPAPLADFSRPVFPSGMGPRQYGEGYRPQNQLDLDGINAERMAEAESLDLTSDLHGGWTIENAKSRLHQFLQQNNVKADYTYNSIGPEHARSFQCEMHFFVKQLGRGIIARETGSNKQTSSKSCALSLVRQLYHLKVIEPYSGVTKRQIEANFLKPYEVVVDPNIMNEVNSLLQHLNIKPPTTAEAPKHEEGGGEGVNLLPEMRKDLPFLHVKEDTNNFSIVSWSPPVPNWNPWTSSNIDEGHMASATLEQLSEEFLQSYRDIQQTNLHYQQLLETRSNLPVYPARENIMSAISENPIILIKGDTGCGKTTQICQFILDDYILSQMGAHCNVIITQPRRISAISVAERVASERAEELGQSVGYSVRFESCLPRPYASILFCTVGVLLRKLEAGLRGVSHVIVDEIHERDVNTDFLLVVLRDMLSAYPELRVILMSATIDDTLFREYFNNCPVVTVEGRLFPVETYFLEDTVELLQFMPSPESIRAQKKGRKEEDDEGVADVSDENLNILPPGSGYSDRTRRAMSFLNERDVNLELLVAILDHIQELQSGQEYKSSILIFLPGWNLIFMILKYLMLNPVYGSKSFVLLPLHSQLPREDQHRVFESVPPNITKIILSTNIAETSITIDDVGFVIDSCKAKTKLFTSHNNMTTFVTMYASRSNLIQRRGRAGRVQEGLCFHLCSRARFDKMDESMTPEILRTPLHEIALLIKLLRLGGISHFLSKAPEPPPLDAVIEAQAMLYELNCLNDEAELTGLGKVLAKLPLDPRLGKMIVLGTLFGCADALAIIAANSSNMNEVFNLGIENKRLHPVQRGFAANRNSDHYALLNAFQQWSSQERRGEQAELNFCQERMLSLPSLRMTRDAKNQLLQVMSTIGFPDEQLVPLHLNFREDSPTLDNIAALLVSGLYPNVCYHKEKRKVLTTESKAALVHKASVNCSRFEIEYPYPFFIFGEKIRTRAVSCKQMTNISPVHLLLFGSKKAEIFTENMIRLDNWLYLRMNPDDAAAILSLRPVVENVVIKATEDPEGFFPLSADDESVINVVSNLNRLATARYGLEDYSYLPKKQSNNAAYDYDRQAEQEYYENFESQSQLEEYPSGENTGDDNGSQVGDYEMARGVKRSLEHSEEDPNVADGNQFSPPKMARGSFRYFDQSEPTTPRGGFRPRAINKFSPRGYSPAGSAGPSPAARGGFGLRCRGGQSNRFGTPRGFSSSVAPSTSRFAGSGNTYQPRRLLSSRIPAPSAFQPRQKFFNSNRGGWSARGNNTSSGGFSQGRPGPRVPRAPNSFRQNYNY